MEEVREWQEEGHVDSKVWMRLAKHINPEFLPRGSEHVPEPQVTPSRQSGVRSQKAVIPDAEG